MFLTSIRSAPGIERHPWTMWPKLQVLPQENNKLLIAFSGVWTCETRPCVSLAIFSTHVVDRNFHMSSWCVQGYLSTTNVSTTTTKHVNRHPTENNNLQSHVEFLKPDVWGSSFAQVGLRQYPGLVVGKSHTIDWEWCEGPRKALPHLRFV